MTFTDYPPCVTAPVAGHYGELNVFGAHTGRVAEVQEGEELPSAPRGFTWRLLNQRSPTELRDLARDYRCLAATASTRETHDALLRLDRRFVDLAAAENPPR